MLYPVNEIFETIQGEATFTGTPAVFIRLQGCPVGCGWCDTKHTWEVKQEKKVSSEIIFLKNTDSEEYASFSTDEIINALKQYKATHIVLTGGEPCLYDLTELTTELLNYGYAVQIETSGTHEIKADTRTWITVSPKINMDGGFKVLKSCILKADEIKHPVGKEKDVDLLINLFKELDIDIANQDIWLQPLSQNKKATQVCIQQATLNNWRISVQTHKYIDVR